MLDDSLTTGPFERLLTALLELPMQQSPHDCGDGAAQLMLEVIDTALHTPPAWPQRMAAVRYFCKHARHRLGLESLRDLQALQAQYPQATKATVRWLACSGMWKPGSLCGRCACWCGLWRRMTSPSWGSGMHGWARPALRKPCASRWIRWALWR